MKFYKWEHKRYLYFSENKKKLQGTKDTRNYSTMYSGVKLNIGAQCGAMAWTQNTGRSDYYKFWDGRIL